MIILSLINKKYNKDEFEGVSMKKKISVLLTLVLLTSLLAACGKKEKEVQPVKDEPVNQEEETTMGEWDEISCKDIAKEMGAGWNVGNQLEGNSNGKPFETAWNSTPITPQLIKAVHDAGFKSIRVPVSYLGRIGEGPDYTIEEKWLDRIQAVVDYCYEYDMYVIINMHGDGYGSVKGGWLLPYEENQTPILEKYEAVWKQIAVRFADYDEHLIFESMNEVGSEKNCTKELYTNINNYNQLFLNTIRQAGGFNDRRYVLVPGYNTNIDETASNSNFVIPDDIYLSKDVAEGEKRVMISVHYYSPWSFCGGETDDATQWGVNADSSKSANWGEEAFLEQQFKLLSDVFTSKGYPVIIGEYGAIDKSKADPENNTYRAAFCNAVCTMAIKYGLVPVYWDNGYNGKYGFGLFDRKTFAITQQQIIDGIMTAFKTEEVAESTSLKLADKELNLTAGGASKTIKVEVSSGNVTYTSSDYSVALVNKDGVVVPQLVGNCDIIVRDDTGITKVKVKVEEAKVTNMKLYLLETKGWQTFASDQSISLEKDGKFTLSLKVSDDAMGHIGSLYFKDAGVQDGILKSSLCKKGSMAITSVEINGEKMTLNDRVKKMDLLSGTTVDCFILNKWANPDSEGFKEGVINEDGDYKIDKVKLNGTNEIKVTFSVNDISY